MAGPRTAAESSSRSSAEQMQKNPIMLVAALVALAISACDSPTEPDDRWARPENIQFAESLNIDLGAMTRTQSGLYWQDLQVGAGTTAAAYNTVRVHYTGWLPDGTMFESSRTKNAPIEFLLGVGLVIRGWDEGIVGMQVGGTRKLVIRPELAYGRSGKGPIPPLTTLIFDVELLYAGR
jgi:FKBP-type peptidyl-prolyl cis-trans isomerase FkpA